MEHPAKKILFECCKLNFTSINCQFCIKIGTIKSTKSRASQLEVMGDTKTNISGTEQHILPKGQYYSVLERSPVCWTSTRCKKFVTWSWYHWFKLTFFNENERTKSQNYSMYSTQALKFSEGVFFLCLCSCILSDQRNRVYLYRNNLVQM